MSRRAVLCALLISALLLVGCGNRVIFTAGPVGDVAFVVGDETVPLSELKVYFVTLQKEYENLYGAGVWSEEGNSTAGAAVRDNALAQLSRVKVLGLMADRDGIAVTEDEHGTALQAAADYYASLNAAERTYLGVSEEDVASMYDDYTLAGKEYQHILSAVDPEVSDDEARSVTCQYIFLAAADDALSRAQAIRQEIADGIANLTGVTFLQYISTYSEDTQQTMSISRAQSDAALVAAAFSLDLNAISDPVETDKGVYILKCISLSDESQTDENKKTILKERQDAAFEEAYNSFLETLDYGIDEESVAGITIVTDENVETSAFFTTWDRYFDAAAQQGS